ncbi:hypothetical protein LSAT2_025736 [Lamellibrachia satsuma]|nr:hypothetical protein LSAT2_025736 [Lamellibrachia satsuma]
MFCVTNNGPTASVETMRLYNDNPDETSYDLHIHKDNRTTADKLGQEVRLFCVVMISEDSFKRSGRAITETWAGHCNNSMFMIEKDVNKGRGSAVETFDYIYKHHYKDADWFLVVSDHTYVIVENLVYFLASQNHSEPVYFGCTIRVTGVARRKGRDCNPS